MENLSGKFGNLHERVFLEWLQLSIGITIEDAACWILGHVEPAQRGAVAHSRRRRAIRGCDFMPDEGAASHIVRGTVAMTVQTAYAAWAGALPGMPMATAWLPGADSPSMSASGPLPTPDRETDGAAILFRCLLPANRGFSTRFLDQDATFAPGLWRFPNRAARWAGWSSRSPRWRIATPGRSMLSRRPPPKTVSSSAWVACNRSSGADGRTGLLGGPQSFQGSRNLGLL